MTITYAKPKLDKAATSAKYPTRYPEIFGVHATPHGEYATDSYRLYWTCPTEELPEKLQRVATVPDDATEWTVSENLRSWLQCAAKVCKPAPLHLNGRYSIDRQYARFGDVSHAEYQEAPPVHSDACGFNPQYLFDALAYLTAKRGGTLRVSWPNETGPLYIGTDDRHVVVMPVKLREG